jgi:hypothetical protein
MSSFNGWVTLVGGREISLVRFEQYRTYSGLLEGNPYPKYNDDLIARAVESAKKSHEIWPVHTIMPTRSYLQNDSCDPGTEPNERLPAITCTAKFVSKPIDDINHFSLLIVLWWQESFGSAVDEHFLQRLQSLEWERLAMDGDY